MYLESMDFDNQRDSSTTVSAITTEDASWLLNDADDSRYTADCIASLEAAMQFYTNRKMRDVKVVPQVIGHYVNADGFTIWQYESYQVACDRTKAESQVEFFNVQHN